MNRLQLYRLLRRNDRLRERRNPAFDQNRVARVVYYVVAAIASLYLIFIGVGLGFAARQEQTPALIVAAMPIVMTVDFLLRFVAQQTPAMLVKPYVLLPLPRTAVVETFVARSLLSGYNWLWLCLLAPHAAVMLATGVATVGQALLVVLTGMALMLANSQWYLIVRTLIHRTLLWWLLPMAVYAAYYVPMVLTRFSLAATAADCLLTLPTLLAALMLLAALAAVNSRLQCRSVYRELRREEKKTRALKSVTRFAFLERFGQTGEYLKLELKSTMRNKAVRSRMVMSLVIIVMFTLLLAYTDIYDGRVMQSFWCYYCFALYGMTTLVKVMGSEGNYIDLLMTQRENILLLLRAKYYFHTAILLVPCVLMLPAVFAGKFSPLMMVGYLLFSAGALHFALFQLAVFNKQTLPLNEKITGKGNVESGFQLLFSMGCMLLPLLLVTALLLAFDDERIVFGTLSAVGLVFVVLHPWWLRSVYRRMMRRKYVNLEGFHATR